MRKRTPEQLRRAAEHFAFQYGPTFAKAAYAEAVAEDPEAAARMTEAELVERMGDRLRRIWKEQGTAEALLTKEAPAAAAFTR